jgi:regulator of protease activity HflC (stomatin/prohibitin superfamily)
MSVLRSRPPGQPDEYGVKAGDVTRYAVIAILVLIVFGAIFFWFFCRIEVGERKFCPLMRKTGENITNEMILVEPEYKGPQFEILREGRHFRSPYRWKWPRPMDATEIPNDTVGVLIRRFGRPLAEGQVVIEKDEDVPADDKQKGILAKPLYPGLHYVNLWGYDVEQHPMVNIKAGYVGVVTRLVGKEHANPNVFVVRPGERGTQPFLLTEKTYAEYSNPYVFLVTPIDVRSQKFQMAGKDIITFPSKFGFDIKVEGTIEWAPEREKLPEVFVKYVDEQDLKESGGINNIQRKIILPFARSYLRLVGGQYRAVDYITGDTRIRVQNEVEDRLREACAKEGITIKSFVIHKTKPPVVIQQQYERREIAMREVDRFSKEVETEIGTSVMEGAKPKLGADGKPVLDERGQPVMVGGTPKVGPEGKPMREGGRLDKVLKERRIDRETKFGAIREKIAEKVRDAERYEGVETTKAMKELEVARINLEAAKDRAAKVLAEGKAEAAVTVMKHTAEAEAVKAKVAAFVTGEKYAEHQLIVKFSPGIRRILSNTEGLFAELFERFARTGASGKAPTAPSDR